MLALIGRSLTIHSVRKRHESCGAMRFGSPGRLFLALSSAISSSYLPRGTIMSRIRRLARYILNKVLRQGTSTGDLRAHL